MPTTARPTKGRGATANPASRYRMTAVDPVDDGWPAADSPEASVRTTVTADPARSVLSFNTSPDVPFDRSVNPYRGCEHGCIYCYARPSHAWLELSPGLDFETRLFAKHDAANVLAAELRRPGYQPAPIALGANTDCWQPVERDLRISRAVLELLHDCGHPVTIVTKSSGIERDVDLLAAMAGRNLVHVAVSVTTLDPELARRMEPRAAAPWRRLETIRRLSQAGIPVHVLVAPVIPALNEPEIESILEACAQSGAAAAGYVTIRLPLEVNTLFAQWLNEHYPDRARRVLHGIESLHGGRRYDRRFGHRQRGNGERAKIIAKRFEIAMRRHGLGSELPRLDLGQFQPPPACGDQLNLF
ncbi:MAG: PA0069 family radical SAM protein [Chromatiales bacterium]|nr:PA0069 family radical SAM protein [Chromatiales bacterium]